MSLAIRCARASRFDLILRRALVCVRMLPVTAEREDLESGVGPTVPSGASSGAADDDADLENTEDPEGAPAELAALSLGLNLPQRDEQLAHWTRALERNAHAGLLKETTNVRSAADVTQHPRFRLLQELHRAVVHRLLVDTALPFSEEMLWRNRVAALSQAGMVPSIPREAFQTLAKHAAAGLTNTYTKRIFGPSKLHLRKVRKVLIGLLPHPDQRLPGSAPLLPDKLEDQLRGILLSPPAPTGTPGPITLEVWSAAADALLCLSLVSGSVLSLLQLPCAIYSIRTTVHDGRIQRSGA